jgi:hypothetical protein
MIEGLTKDELRLIERYREAKIKSLELVKHGHRNLASVVGKDWTIPDTSSGLSINASVSVRFFD